MLATDLKLSKDYMWSGGCHLAASVEVDLGFQFNRG